MIAYTTHVNGFWIVLPFLILTVFGICVFELGWLLGRWKQSREELIVMWDERDPNFEDVSQWMLIVCGDDTCLYFRGQNVEDVGVVEARNLKIHRLVKTDKQRW